MLYAVSLAYKESANVSTHAIRIRYLTCVTPGMLLSDDGVCSQCRLEANYAHQQEVDMIPLMMQKDFKPKGWLGLILGTRMW